MVHLGSFYWNEEIGVGGIIANDFDFTLPKNVRVLGTKSLCPCGNYGRKITFIHEGNKYSFNFLTGYPCQCKKEV